MALKEVRGGEDGIARVVDVHDAVMVTVDAAPAGVLEGGGGRARINAATVFLLAR